MTPTRFCPAPSSSDDPMFPRVVHLTATTLCLAAIALFAAACENSADVDSQQTASGSAETVVIETPSGEIVFDPDAEALIPEPSPQTARPVSASRLCEAMTKRTLTPSEPDIFNYNTRELTGADATGCSLMGGIEPTDFYPGPGPEVTTSGEGTTYISLDYSFTIETAAWRPGEFLAFQQRFGSLTTIHDDQTLYAEWNINDQPNSRSTILLAYRNGISYWVTLEHTVNVDELPSGRDDPNFSIEVQSYEPALPTTADHLDIITSVVDGFDGAATRISSDVADMCTRVATDMGLEYSESPDQEQAVIGLVGIYGEVLCLGPSAFDDSGIETVVAEDTSAQIVLLPGSPGIDDFNTLANRCFQRLVECASGKIAIVVNGEVASSAFINLPEFDRDRIFLSEGRDDDFFAIAAEMNATILSEPRYAHFRPIIFEQDAIGLELDALDEDSAGSEQPAGDREESSATTVDCDNPPSFAATEIGTYSFADLACDGQYGIAAVATDNGNTRWIAFTAANMDTGPGALNDGCGAAPCTYDPAVGAQLLTNLGAEPDIALALASEAAD